MKERLRSEIYRKSFHLTGVTVPISYVLFGREVAILFTSVALLAFVALEFVRIRAHSLFPLAKIASLVERQSEKVTVAATVYFCIAADIVLIFLNSDAVIIGLTAALLSDTAAALIGVGIGSHHIGHKKTVEGTIAGVFVAALVVFLLNSNLIIAIIVGIIFLFFDLIDIGIDDNFSTPLIMVIAIYFLELIL
jgi:dolichol kinase